MAPRRQTSRGYMVPLLLVVPMIAGACALVALERHAMQPPAVITDTRGFGEALRNDDLEQAFEFVRAGQDPNRPVEFRDGDLTGNREVLVAPLLIAVAMHRDNAVMMLMSFGGRLDAPANRFALCLAKYVHDENIADILVRDGGPAVATIACPATAPASSAPLLAFVE